MIFDKFYEKANRKRIKHIARIDPAEHGMPDYLVAHKLTLENFRTGTPGETLWVCFDLIDQVEHLRRRILHQGAAADFDHGSL